MIILGINAYHPDSSACIIKDGMLIAAAEEERFLRIKHWAGFPRESIRYCLREAGIDVKGVDCLALNRNLYANFHKKIGFTFVRRPSFPFIKDQMKNKFKILTAREALAREFSVSPRTIRAKVYAIEHHRAHLGSCFFVSPFSQATVISVDGFGDFSSCMVGRGTDEHIDTLYEINFPHSLGIFYTACTQFLGFKKFGDEFKVMALAAYGKPTFLKEMSDILVLKPKGRFVINTDYFSFFTAGATMQWNNTEPILADVFSDRWEKLFGPPRDKEGEISQRHCDFAASLQAHYEKAFFHILQYAYGLTGLTNLCLAGGCALNSVANGKIFDCTPFKEVYIQPAASDAGGSLGAAYYCYHQIRNKPRVFVMNTSYWGPAFRDQEILELLTAEQLPLKAQGCVVTHMDSSRELCTSAAAHIANGRIVGWFQGRMEWGPRALGNRSILADPRRAEMKEILNARIKKREWFRPFAPSILIERVDEYFEKNYPDPFMLKVYKIRQEKRHLIPAVTHVDGTGRLQTVAQEENPLYWQLIKEFEQLTGLPIVLNTSFNENEPIVCTPQEALDCFLRTRMDVLVVGRTVIEKGKNAVASGAG